MDGARSETSIVLLIIGVIASILAVFAGALLFMSRSMMGGMMGTTGGGPGLWDVGVLGVAIVIAIVSLGLALRPRGGRAAPAMNATPVGLESVPASGIPATVPSEDRAQLQRLQEAAVVRALDEDERQLYIRIREAGGVTLQRDLVASGQFSKAKVTRLLDKLERKGLVVRERYGATNRVRLTWKA